MSMMAIELPLSKSVVNRVLIAMAAQGKLTQWLLQNPSVVSNGCRDTRLLVDALQGLASGMSEFDFQDAGTPCRLFTAYAAVCAQKPITVSGNISLNNRSILPLMDALVAMGAEVEFLEKPGHTPFTIKSGIKNWHDTVINTSVSSQYASALMLMAPLFAGQKRITLQDNTHSQTYIDLTLHVLEQMGIELKVETGTEGKNITILSSYKAISTPLGESMVMEADWSASAFFYPLLLGMGESKTLLLEGLSLSSVQGDAAMAALGKWLGIETETHADGVILRSSLHLKNPSESEKSADKTPPNVDLKNNPDLVPAFVVGCCILKQSLLLEGIHNLRYKECDRIAALQENLAYLDCTLEPMGDEKDDRWLLDTSNRNFPSQMHVETRHDHRIAMAFSTLKPWIQELTFSDSDCVEKSFPNYWEQWKKCTFE